MVRDIYLCVDHRLGGGGKGLSVPIFNKYKISFNIDIRFNFYHLLQGIFSDIL